MTSETITKRLDATVHRQGHRRALTFLRNNRPETTLTYARLGGEINRCAQFLIQRGVGKGERVILLTEKCLFSVVAHFALLGIGAIAVPLNPGFKRSELAYLISDADPGLVITEPGKSELIRDIDPRVQILTVSTRIPYQDLDVFGGFPGTAPEVDVKPEDPGLIIYTSGTTGNPKGAVLTQKNLLHDADTIIAAWQISQNDVLCHALPLFHIHGLCFALHTCLLAGTHVCMLDQFDAQAVLAQLAGETGDAPCTVFMAVPTMYAKMMDAPADAQRQFDHLRLLTSGSAPLLVRDFERIRNVFDRRPVEREGMSETGMNFSNPIEGIQKPGSIGLPLPGVSVRVVDPKTGKDVEKGDVGELWLKSPSITPGYWRKPEETRAAFDNGWFKTGDLGMVDADGYYYLTDRIKHIIITGGENVSAKEVETVINQLDDVTESSVVGIPDAKWGETVAAAVVVKDGSDLSAAAMVAHCKKNLHDWKCPKKIVFVKRIPKNTMGKMLKEEVKSLLVPIQK
jgi:malonyl-CoA/methylmalonyl-CoA synthetase